MKDRTPGYKTEQTYTRCVHQSICIGLFHQFGNCPSVVSLPFPSDFWCKYYEPLETRSKRK